MPKLSWLPAAKDLETIARNIGLVRPPDPPDILGTLATALGDELVQATEYAAGLLFKLVLDTVPYGKDSWAYAVEAARVILIVNGYQAGRISHEKIQALRSDVEQGLVDSPDEIGLRLTTL